MVVAGSSVVAPGIAVTIKSSKSKAGEQNIVYRTLCNTGIELPIVSMGTDNTDNPALIKAAMERGVKLFTTSE
jgi:hypothetical protein